MNALLLFMKSRTKERRHPTMTLHHHPYLTRLIRLPSLHDCAWNPSRQLTLVLQQHPCALLVYQKMTSSLAVVSMDRQHPAAVRHQSILVTTRQVPPASKASKSQIQVPLLVIVSKLIDVGRGSSSPIRWEKEISRVQLRLQSLQADGMP